MSGRAGEGLASCATALLESISTADETITVMDMIASNRGNFIDRSDLSQIGPRHYFPPILHDLQIPNPLPFAWIKAQDVVNLFNSVADSSPFENSVSVVVNSVTGGL